MHPRLDDGVERPGADDLVRLRAQRPWETPAGGAPDRDPTPETICGVSDEVAQVSITSGSPTNPPGLPRSVSLRPRGGDASGSSGRSAGLGEDRVLVVHRAVVAHRIPDRERHPGEALAAHAPVLIQALHPVLVAHPHVLGMPLDAPSLLEQLVLDVEDAHEPLARRHELERPIALLVELHRDARPAAARRSARRPRPPPRSPAAPAARSCACAPAPPTCRRSRRARRWRAPGRDWRTARRRSRPPRCDRRARSTGATAGPAPSRTRRR